jgi:branched-chain amino acid transport system substrate-binding protein
MRSVRTRALLAGLSAAALLAAGCGQKPGVADMYVSGGAAASGAAGVEAGAPGTDGLGQGLGGGQAAGSADSLAAGGLSAGGSGAGTTDAGTTSGGGGGGGGGGAGNGSTDPKAATGPDARNSPAGGGDSTGVTDTTITVGIHAPVTGAAAFPQRSFERGVGVYAEYINSKGGINGRKLRVLFRDDRFDPNAARSVCKELVEQEKVFLLMGGGGADQIDACARYAATQGVPYLGPGVHESRPGLGSLGNLATYFANSLTYEQQIPLLTNLVRGEFNGQKVALLVADNDSLNDFYAAADSSLKQAVGENLVLSRRIPKKTEVDAPSIGTQICNSGAKVVVWNASPGGLVNVSKAMPCSADFIGPGNTAGLNVVATAGCPNIDGAQFFSSFPGMDRINQMDPNFAPAYRKSRGAEPDDIGIALWGGEKGIAQMLEAAGKNLTREGFMSTIARVKRFDNGVFPPTNFTSRFGGTAMHLLKADCSSRQYRTKKLNVRP